MVKCTNVLKRHLLLRESQFENGVFFKAYNIISIRHYFLILVNHDQTNSLFLSKSFLSTSLSKIWRNLLSDNLLTLYCSTNFIKVDFSIRYSRLSNNMHCAECRNRTYLTEVDGFTDHCPSIEHTRQNQRIYQ